MEKLTPEKIAQIKNILQEMDYNPSNQSLIQDNKIVFQNKSGLYRCRMPSQKEQVEAESEQNRYKMKIINNNINLPDDEKIKTRKQLIDLLKESGTADIEELNKKKEKLKKELHDAYIDLASLHDDEKDEIEKYREIKNNIESKFMEISIEIHELLSSSLEEQTKRRYYEYLAYKCSEKLHDSEISGVENWKAVWENFDKYTDDDSDLSYIALDKIQTLLLNVRD